MYDISQFELVQADISAIAQWSSQNYLTLNSVQIRIWLYPGREPLILLHICLCLMARLSNKSALTNN